MEQLYIQVFGAISAINAEVEGMKAANQAAEYNKDAPAYTANDFMAKAQEIRDATQQLFR